jgi:hypothetical protein
MPAHAVDGADCPGESDSHTSEKCQFVIESRMLNVSDEWLNLF